MQVQFQILPGGDASLIPPKRTSAGAAGYDLCACLSENIPLEPLARTLVPTGFAIALPKGVEAQIRPRSGLSIKHGITVINAPGTIDWDYRGEIKVPLVNLGHEVFEITHGMRIAQMVFARVELPEFLQAELSETARGNDGFGSTGVK